MAYTLKELVVPGQKLTGHPHLDSEEDLGLNFDSTSQDCNSQHLPQFSQL